MTATRFKLTPYTPSEHDVQGACLDLLRRHPKVAKAIRYNCGTLVQQVAEGRKRWIRFNDAPGHLDIGLVLKGGRAGYIEIKRRGEKMTAAQQVFFDEMEAAGALVAVIDRVEDLVELLNAL